MYREKMEIKKEGDDRLKAEWRREVTNGGRAEKGCSSEEKMEESRSVGQGGRRESGGREKVIIDKGQERHREM